MDLSLVRKVLEEIVDFALNALPKLDFSTVRSKKDAADLVSGRDYAMESKIVETIHRAFPDHIVVSEEAGQVGERSEFRWLVDPIDGSCNDSHEIPWSSVSVACVDEEKMIAGTVIHPYTGQVFQAFRGQGATLNGKPIHCQSSGSLPGSVVMTELRNQHPWQGLYAFMDWLAKEDATLRIMGSTALSIAQVAAGRAAATVIDEGGQLDVTAGVLLALEAGAEVLCDGEPLAGLPKGQLIIACPGVLEQVKNVVCRIKAE